MSPVLQWWDGLSSPVRWVVGLVYSVGVTLVLFGTIAALAPDDWSLLAISLVGAAISFAIFMPLGVVVQARRMGGWHQLTLWRRAYSTGVVASEAEVDRWLPIARRNLRYFRQMRVVFRIAMGAMLCLLLVLTVALGFVDDERRIVVVMGVYLVVFVVVAWAVDRMMRWRVEQFERLVPTLEGRTAPAEGP